MRLVESLGSYIYTQNGNEIAMNLYISNNAELKVDEKDFCLSVNTQMPWNGKTEIEITKAGNGTDKNTDAVLRLRIPEWADGSNKVYVNGEEVSAEADATGYINITKSWSENDKITLDLEMNTVRYYDKEEIKNNIGCVAVKRGPVIYAAEAADNDFDINKAYLPADSKLETVWSENLMNDNDDVYGLKSGMYVTASGIVDDFGVEKEVQWKLIPYYAWNNRGNGNMRIYISENKVKTSLRDYANVSASYSFETTLQNINDNSKDTFWNGWNDPKLQSENQWVMYDFGKNKAQLTGMTVNWYDDRSGVAVPEKIIVEYWNDDTEGWEEVTATSDFSKCINKEDNLYTFEKVTTSKIRMTMVNGTIDGSKKVAAAIFDWDLIGEFDSSVNKPELPDDTEETTENPQPELPDDTGKTEVPQPETGDESNPWLYVVICMFAALCGVSAFIWKNKKGGRTCQK